MTCSLPPPPPLVQAAGDAPTTPKYTKEHRDYFFPTSLTTPILFSHTTCHPLPSHEGPTKASYEPPSKPSRPPAMGFHDQPLPQQRRGAAAMAFIPHTGMVRNVEMFANTNGGHLLRLSVLCVVSRGHQWASRYLLHNSLQKCFFISV